MKNEISNVDVTPRMRRVAEQWFVRLLDTHEGDPARAEFERWLAASPAHAIAYRKVDRVWALSRAAARHSDIKVMADRIPDSRTAAASRPRRSWLRPAVAMVAVLIVLAGAGAWRWWYIAHANQTDIVYTTAIGQRRKLDLKDGSVVLLDTDSVVDVHYGRGARKVGLKRGRAEFTVKHNPDRPFIVHAGDGVVTDLGTTFQVSVGGNGNVNVVLIRGKVSVKAARSETVLLAGQALRFNRAGIVRAAHPADLSFALGWTRGKLIVHNWPLPRLVAAMNRYSSLKLEIADPALGNVRVTGTFRAGDQRTLIKVLQSGWSIHADRVSPESVRLSGERGGRSLSSKPDEGRRSRG